MNLEAFPKTGTPYRVFLEEKPEGVYVFVFETPTSRFPEKDWLQDDWDMAKRSCKRRFGISYDEWMPLGKSTSSNVAEQNDAREPD